MHPDNLDVEPRTGAAANADNAGERPNPANIIDSYFGLVPSVENMKFIEDNKLLFLSSKTEVINPEEETYPEMLKINFCPHLLCLSLTTGILLASTVFYILAVSQGLEKKTFLEVQTSTLYHLGMNNARMVYQGEVYRLLTNLLLHVNISHLVSAMLILVYVLPFFEHTFGMLRMLLVLLGSGLAASIFSNLLSVDENSLMLKAGLNPCLYGVIGLGFGYLLVNWPSLKLIGPVFKFKIVVNLLFAVVFLLIFTEKAAEADLAGIGGGFLAGFFAAGMMPSIDLEKRQIIVRVVLCLFFFTMITACLLCFYLLPQAGYSN